MTDLAIERIDGGQRLSIRQGKWTPLKVALIPLAVALLLGIASVLFFCNGNWTLGIIAGALAGLSGLLAVPFAIVLVILTLTLRERAAFSVTADAIRLEEKNGAGYPDVIAVKDILSIHHGAPRSSSDVAVGGLVGDLAGFMGLAFAGRSSAVWLNVGGRGIYLARQIRPAEAAEIFNRIKSIVRLG